MPSFNVAFVIALVWTSTLHAQATRVTAPVESHLLRITQAWGASSPLGDLRARAMDSTDVELRFWGGYGLGGAAGTVLRRTQGQWQAWHVRIVTCRLFVPGAVGDTLTAPSEAAYQAEAIRRCREPSARSAAGDRQRVIDADTVELFPIAKTEALPAIFTEVLDAGVAALPPAVPRSMYMYDGYTYVVEFRRATEYRASVIEAISPAVTTPDRAVQQVDAILRRHGLSPH